jgi:hypothetical protein
LKNERRWTTKVRSLRKVVWINGGFCISLSLYIHTYIHTYIIYIYTYTIIIIMYIHMICSAGIIFLHRKKHTAALAFDSKSLISHKIAL